MVEWVKVIDVSLNQGAIDFVKMRATGVQGLILRVSHGQTIDARYGGYYVAALAAGYAPDDIATYSFINPKRGTAAQCAAVTMTEIQRVVGHTNVGHMPDIENYKGQSPNIGQAPVFGAAFAAYIREYIATVRQIAKGATIFGYSNQAYWNGPVGNGEVWVGDDQLASEIEWLAARYPAYSDAQYAHYGYPGTPDTWPDWAFKAQPQGPLPPKGGKWLGWQFSAGFNKQGHTYGATSGDLDLNIVQPDAWRRWTDKDADTIPNPQPPVESDDMAYLATNAEPRQMPWGLQPPGAEFFVVDSCRRGCSQDEKDHAWAGVVAKPLLNATLDAIPEAGAGGATDTVARARIDALNDSVGRVGQSVGDIQSGLIKAGGG